MKQIEELVAFAYHKRKASVVVLNGPFVAAPADGVPHIFGNWDRH